MQNVEIAKYLLDNDRYIDLFKLARYTYRANEPLVNDAFYDALEKEIRKNNLSELVNQSYDDDPIPYDLLEEFNLTYLIYETDEETEYTNYLDGEKSLSIKAFNTYRETFEYFMSTPEEDKIMSPKVNGVNIKSLFRKESEGDPNKFTLGMTRGRSGNGMNITRNLSRICPNKVESSIENCIVYGEAVVQRSALNLIPRKNDAVFTSERMAALSMLRVDVGNEYYKYLKYLTFNAEGIADTISETIDKLRDSGFDSVDYILIKAEEVPKDFNTFCEWLKSKMDKIYQMSVDADIPTDGVVIDINSKTYVSDINNQYSSRNCALKFGYWDHRYYTGVIKDIHIEQQRVNASVVIEIEAMKTADNTEARRITSYNPSYIIDNDLTVGSTVYFERNSEAINVILVGDRLKEVLNREKEGTTPLSSFTNEASNG